MFFNVRRIDEKTIFASVSNLFMHSTIYATLGEVDNILSYTSMSIMVIEMKYVAQIFLIYLPYYASHHSMIVMI